MMEWMVISDWSLKKHDQVNTKTHTHKLINTYQQPAFRHRPGIQTPPPMLKFNIGEPA